MSKHILCDTNIVVRYLLGEETPQGLKATELLDKAQAGQSKILIIESVFVETIFVLSKFYKVPRDKLAFTLRDFLNYRGIISDHKSIWINALQIYASTNLHIVDCILAAKTQESNLELVTFDKDLEKYLSSN